MADIFISYSKIDHALALKLSAFLESEGWSVWWDRSLGAAEPQSSADVPRPAPTKDSCTLRTVAEARAYMLGLSKDRELRSQWQRAAELLLAEADVGALSKAVELALFYDAKLGVAAS